MLVLSRKRQETICIGPDIFVTVLSIKGGKVRLGLDAPNDVQIQREEIRESSAFRETREFRPSPPPSTFGQ